MWGYGEREAGPAWGGHTMWKSGRALPGQGLPCSKFRLYTIPRVWNYGTPLYTLVQVGLKLARESKSPGGLVKRLLSPITPGSDAAGLGQSPRICISSKSPGDANTTGRETSRRSPPMGTQAFCLAKERKKTPAVPMKCYRNHLPTCP